MRRMMSLGTAVLISLSLSACTSRNAQLNNNTGQNIGTEQGLNNVNGKVGSNLGAYRSYKDGTYTAQGDKNDFGNQTATVIIKNGRINNIILGMSDNTGRTTGYPSLTSNTVESTNNLTNNTASNNANANTPNTNTGSSKWFEAARNIVFATGGVRGGGRVVDQKPSKKNTNVGNNTGLAPGMAGNTNTSIVKAQTLGLDSLRINLVNAMIQNQTFNVIIPTSNPDYYAIISNWKLAVQRALEKSLR